MPGLTTVLAVPDHIPYFAGGPLWMVRLPSDPYWRFTVYQFRLVDIYVWCHVFYNVDVQNFFTLKESDRGGLGDPAERFGKVNIRTVGILMRLTIVASVEIQDFAF
jgi:hypothetical protein